MLRLFSKMASEELAVSHCQEMLAASIFGLSYACPGNRQASISLSGTDNLSLLSALLCLSN